jgi:hypothetical protein
MTHCTILFTHYLIYFQLHRSSGASLTLMAGDMAITLCSGGTRWYEWHQLHNTNKGTTCAVGERDGLIPLHLHYPIYLCWPHPTITTTQRCTRAREPDGTQCEWGAHCAPPSWVEPVTCPGCGSRLPPLTMALLVAMVLESQLSSCILPCTTFLYLHTFLSFCGVKSTI